MSTVPHPTVSCSVCLLDGARVGLAIDGRRLVAVAVAVAATDCPDCPGAATTLPTPTTFPHLIRGVFPVTADADAATGRVYVLLDGPDPLVELDVATRRYLVVLSAVTQDAYLKRWSSSAALTSLVPSWLGRFVAVALDDGRVVLHKLCTDNGKPTFEAVNVWSFGRGAAVHVTGVGAGGDDQLNEAVRSVSFVVSRRGRVENCTVEAHGTPKAREREGAFSV